MARMGVFTRNDSTPESIPRSLQLLTHRKQFDARYMEIYPNFSEILYPNESITLRVTNFVRSIPMKKPMFSRVRVVQRFAAIPLRILWPQWEDYIKGENEAQFLLEEPYLVNATDDGDVANQHGFTGWFSSPADNIGINGGFGHIKSVSGTIVSSWDTPDDSTIASSTSLRRGIVLTSSSYVPARLKPASVSGGTTSEQERTSYCKFGVHELGDYLGFPLYVGLGKIIDGSNKQYSAPVSAFKFAAYQLMYSYFDRAPNVQTRIDDFAEMAFGWSNSGVDYVNSPSLRKEYPSMLAVTDKDNNPVPPSTYTYDSRPLNSPAIYRGVSWSGVNSKYGSFGSVRNIAKNNNPSSATYRQDVIRSSWENVEKFCLKGGANMSMLASYSDPASGMPTYVPSNISLFRMRFANWQTDYFTSCNPWQQRGDESQIPVSSITNSFEVGGLTLTANSTFSGSPTSIAVGASGVKVYLQDVLDDDRLLSPATFAPNPNAHFTTDRVDNRYTISDSASSYSPLVGNDVDDDNGVRIYSNGLYTPEGSVTTEVTGDGSGYAIIPSGTLYVSPSNFRFAMTLQHIKEMQAQIDNRYQSYIHKFFGARAQDYRLDRPEFLGGSVMELNVSDVNQTSETTSSSPLADVAGKSVSADTSRAIRFHANEHCIIMGTLHIIPDTNYIGGLDRVDSTTDRFDWALPQFSHLSEQAVYNKELQFRGIFGADNRSSNDEVFGYEPVLNHLRWRKNMAVGAFRDTLNSQGTYEYYKPWLITRDFGAQVAENGYIEFNQPTLSDEFLSGRYNRDNSNFDITDDDIMRPFMVDSYFEERLVRVISSRGTPSRLGA